MKDKNDNLTIDGFKRGPGRPKKYASAAERQKAYRESKKRTEVDLIEASQKLLDECKDAADQANAERDLERSIYKAGIATGIYHAWINTISNKLSMPEYEEWSQKFNDARLD